MIFIFGVLIIILYQNWIESYQNILIFWISRHVDFIYTKYSRPIVVFSIIHHDTGYLQSTGYLKTQFETYLIFPYFQMLRLTYSKSSRKINPRIIIKIEFSRWKHSCINFNSISTFDEFLTRSFTNSYVRYLQCFTFEIERNLKPSSKNVGSINR